MRSRDLFLRVVGALAPALAGEVALHTELLRDPSNFHPDRLAFPDSTLFEIKRENFDVSAEFVLELDQPADGIKSVRAWIKPRGPLAATVDADPQSHLASVRVSASGRADSVQSKFFWPSGKHVMVAVGLQSGAASTRVHSWDLYFDKDHPDDSSGKALARVVTRCVEVAGVICAFIVGFTRPHEDPPYLRYALDDAIEEYVDDKDPDVGVRRRFLRLTLIRHIDSFEAVKMAGAANWRDQAGLLDWFDKQARQAVTDLAIRKATGSAK